MLLQVQAARLTVAVRQVKPPVFSVGQAPQTMPVGGPHDGIEAVPAGPLQQRTECRIDPERFAKGHLASYINRRTAANTMATVKSRMQR